MNELIEPVDRVLRRVIEAIELREEGDFLIAGRHSSIWSRPDSKGLPSSVGLLTAALYSNCYSKSFSGIIADERQLVAQADIGWLDSLSQANNTTERWEDDWQVEQLLAGGQIRAVRRGAIRPFGPGQFLTRLGPGVPPQPGKSVSVFFARESRDMQSGFYFIFGETPGEDEDEYQQVRYYWNPSREGAEPLVRQLTSSLNRYRVPFRFKIVNHPSLLGRNDAAVLYVSRRYYRITAELAFDIHVKVSHLLAEDVPLFTKWLQKGLAFAEDPGTSESFGMHRCRLVAEGLSSAFEEGRRSTDDRLDRVRQQFVAAGTSLDRSYLNFAAVDPYEFPQ